MMHVAWVPLSSGKWEGTVSTLLTDLSSECLLYDANSNNTAGDVLS